MLAVAVKIRIAQRMGIHSELTNAKLPVLEDKTRRRLWWSTMAFDYHISELTNYKLTTLIPTWDCDTALNVNDLELRADMKNTLKAHEKPTKALFTVVRSELADFIRHSPFHLNFVNPSFIAMAIAEPTQDGSMPGSSGLPGLEKVADKYVAVCEAGDQLHFMTIWTTRAALARTHLLDHYSRYSKSSVPETDLQRNAGISYSLSMLESDTKLRISPLTKRYLWFVSFYLLALAYLYTLNHLRKWPGSMHAEEA